MVGRHVYRRARTEGNWVCGVAAGVTVAMNLSRVVGELFKFKSKFRSRENYSV